MKSKNAAESASIYSKAKSATAAVPEPDSAPTDGKSIPIIVGAVRLTGDVIWIKTFLNSKNECRAHVAVCFGRNAFGRAISLISLSQDGNYIYRRSGGKVVDPPSAVRFYDGTQTTADPKILSIEGASKTPAFKGYIYAVLENVKIGEFAAEFSDSTIESAVAETCDPDIANLECTVYDPTSGFSYGLLGRGTTRCYIVKTDGCHILDKSPGWFNWELTPSLYIPDNISLIPCTNLLLVVGLIYYPDTDQFQDAPWGWVWNTGSSSYALNNPTDYAQYFAMFPESSIPVSYVPPVSTGIEIDVIYKLPVLGKYAAVRKYDRGAVVADPPALWDYQMLGLDYNVPPGNMACAIIDVPRGGILRGEDELLLSIDHLPTYVSGLGSYYDLNRGTEWTVINAPLVDDFVYCKELTSSIVLAGYKDNAGSVDVFRFQHTAADITYDFTTTITPPTGFTVTGIAYDEFSDTILLSMEPPTPSIYHSRLYRVSSLGVATYTDLGSTDLKLGSDRTSVGSDGKAVLIAADNSAAYSYDLSTDTKTLLASGSASASEPIVDLRKNVVSLPTISGFSRYSTGQVAPDDIPLVNLLTDCCTYKGYDAADLAFQNLSSESVRGLLINSTIRLSDLFNRLGSLFSFTFVETDRKLKFLKKRSGGVLAVDVYLTKDDLVLQEGGGAAFVRTVQRDSSNNLLSGLDLEFMDPDKQYENSTIKIRRPVAAFNSSVSTRLETLSVPISLPAADAYRLMYEAFYTMLQKLNRVSFSVPSWHARIEPGDCISVTVDGVETTGVAVRVSINEAFSQEIELEIYDELGSTQIANPETPTDDSGGSTVGRYIPLETAFLRLSDYVDASHSVRYHGITSAGIGSWGWADLYRSTDGTNYAKILEYGLQPMTVALVSNAVEQPALKYASDDTTELVIEVISGSADDFASVTYLQQMNGANLCAFGGPRRWELISFRTVVDNLDGTLTLSGLQRGLRGTHIFYEPDYGNAHDAGDMLVLLDPAKLVATQYPVSATNMSEWFAVKTQGVDLSESAVGPTIFEDLAMLKFQPANLRATHVAGSSDLEITWDEVTCVPGEWSDAGVETPMHAPVTYQLSISQDGPSFNVSDLTGNSYTWTGYGAQHGTSAIAEDVISQITLQPVVTGLGYGWQATGGAHDVPA